MSKFWDNQVGAVQGWLDSQACTYLKNYKLRWGELEFNLDYLVLDPIPCIVHLIIPGNTFINRWAPVRLLAAQSFGRHLPAIGIITDLDESIGGPLHDLDYFELSIPIQDLQPLRQLLQQGSPDPLTHFLLDKGIPLTDPTVSNDEELSLNWGTIYSPRAQAQGVVLAEMERTGCILENLTHVCGPHPAPLVDFIVRNLGGEHRVETIQFRGRTPSSMNRDVYVSSTGRRTVIRQGQATPLQEKEDLLGLSLEPWLARAAGFSADGSILLLQTYFGPENPSGNEELPVMSGVISFLEWAGWTVLPSNSFFDWMVLLSILREETRSES